MGSELNIKPTLKVKAVKAVKALQKPGGTENKI